MIVPKDKTSSYKTVLLLSAVGIVFYLDKEWKVFLFASLLLSISSLLNSNASELIDKVWRKIAWLLSLIVPKILLTIVFYCILTPTALLSKLFATADPLQLKRKEGSLFRNVNKELKEIDFEKPW
jgi:hypothetical protein